tara:strand:- start:435 stop:1742 length:1308 start_codon:yes stop_codon:yes gene_type:complete
MTSIESPKKKHQRTVSNVVVHGSYGQEPLEFLNEHQQTASFAIYNFAKLPQKRNEWITTTNVRVLGHPFNLEIYPRFRNDAYNDDEIVCILPRYGGKKTGINPVNVRFQIRTKTSMNFVVQEKKGKSAMLWGCVGCDNFKKRDEIIRKDLDSKGTLTVEVDITIGTPSRKVWFPKVKPTLEDDDTLSILYRSMETTSDVTFRVGRAMTKIKAHSNILSVGAPALCEMTSSPDTTTVDEDIVFQDIDAVAFQAMLAFIYTNKLPEVKSDDDEDSVEKDEEDAAELMAKSIVTVADRFGCTPLKLYVESFIVDDILRPSNTSRLLLVADSHSCALLKEACMNAYIADPASVQQQSEEDWNRLKESNDLLVELLDYGLYPGRRKKYIPVLDHGDGTIIDADSYDVTSLRERLVKYHLDTDGSHKMLLQRWKQSLVETK